MANIIPRRHAYNYLLMLVVGCCTSSWASTVWAYGECYYIDSVEVLETTYIPAAPEVPTQLKIRLRVKHYRTCPGPCGRIRPPGCGCRRSVVNGVFRRLRART